MPLVFSILLLVGCDVMGAGDVVIARATFTKLQHITSHVLFSILTLSKILSPSQLRVALSQSQTFTEQIDAF